MNNARRNPLTRDPRNPGKNYTGPNKEMHYGKMFGHPTKGTGYGVLGKMDKGTTKIGDERKSTRLNTKGKGTATRRGDRFPAKQSPSKYTFGNL